jgi:hypothetical protein
VAVGFLLLAFSYWQLAVGFLLLAIGERLNIAGALTKKYNKWLISGFPAAKVQQVVS